MLNLPNALTLIRLALIPVFVALFYWPTKFSNLLAAFVFVLAALTDLLDGYLARRLHETTKFGAFLDPVADKIIVCVALVLIVEYYSVHVGDFFPHVNLLVSIPAMIIIAREIVVSALREWMAELGKRSMVAVSWIGKWKTTIQLVSIAGLIWRANDFVIYGSLVLLEIATLLTIWSMVMYLKVGLSHMREETKAEKAAPVAPAQPAKAAAAEPVPTPDHPGAGKAPAAAAATATADTAASTAATIPTAAPVAAPTAAATAAAAASKKSATSAADQTKPDSAAGDTPVPPAEATAATSNPTSQA